MSHTIIIGINRQKVRSASDLSDVLSQADQADSQEALFHDKGYAAMHSGGSRGSALFTCSEGIFVTPGFLDVAASALSNVKVVARYTEDCMKAFLKRHGIRAKIESDRAEKSPSTASIDMIFVAIDEESLEGVSIDRLHDALSDYVECLDTDTIAPRFQQGIWIDPIMHMTRPMIGLHAVTSDIETVQVWDETVPLYGNAIKVVDAPPALREYLHLTYLLSIFGSCVLLSGRQESIQDPSLALGVKLIQEVA